MKVLSVQQPWASIICTGVKNVENRSWKPKEIPGRILIHAGAKRVPKDFDDTNPNLEVVSALANMKMFGILPQYNELPTSAIIGYVDVVGFDEDNDSLWAGAESIHWQLENAYLFDEPIEGVKGKLGLFDYPLDEDNLPPAHKVELNYPTLEGELMTVHLSDEFWKMLMKDDSIFTMDINDPYVIETICKEDSFELKPVKGITFKNGKLLATYKVKNYGWDAFKTPDGKEITYKLDNDGPEILWMYAVYELEK